MKYLALILCLLTANVSANSRQQVYKLPYFTINLNNGTYALYFANPTNKEMDCMVKKENAEYPIITNVKVDRISKPVIIKGLTTRFMFMCKEVIRT